MVSILGQITINRQQKIIEKQQEALQERGVWMNELISTLLKGMSNRWSNENAQQAWKEFLEANPHLNRPNDFHPFTYIPQNPELPEPPK